MASGQHTNPQNPQNQFPTTFNPAPGVSGHAPTPPLGSPIFSTPASSPPVAAPIPHAVVNSTADPRIIWEDGQVAVIEAKNFPAHSGMGRSKTRATLKAAIGAPIDDQLQTPVGAGSMNELVKVWLRELLVRPPASMQPATQVPVRLPLSPKDFRPVAPVVAKSGTYAGRVIPDFPHTCNLCGGPYYEGNFTSVHPTPDGTCPATQNKSKPKRR